jgi:hypothetical protein
VFFWGAFAKRCVSQGVCAVFVPLFVGSLLVVCWVFGPGGHGPAGLNFAL